MDQELKSTRYKPGWLIPYLTGLDNIFFKRWSYWFNAVMEDKIPNEPIPYIEFRAPYCYNSRKVQSNLKKCLDYAHNYSSHPLEQLIDWILWGFAYKSVSFPHINEKIDNYWYRTFNMGLFYEEPADWWSDLASEYQVGKYHGFFATPAQVIELMVRMNFGNNPQHEHKRLSVMDPCAGTGNMLLHASNYSLNLYAVDINPLLCKIMTVNAYIYIPWLVYRPKHLTMFDDPKCEQAIIEIELPTGIKIPECQTCKNTSEFVLDLETEHEIEVNPLGFINIDQPKISQDLINKKLKPENISCARCLCKAEMKGELALCK